MIFKNEKQFLKNDFFFRKNNRYLTVQVWLTSTEQKTCFGSPARIIPYTPDFCVNLDIPLHV